MSTASAFGELELELPELEGELEGELESGFGELELELGELENPEMFGWGDAARLARRGWGWLTKPESTQRRVALNTAKAAIKGGSTLLGSKLIGGDTGKAISDILGTGLSSLLPDKELELELFGESGFGESGFGESGFGEFELELSPIRRIYPDAIMEHMAHEAAEAESEHEAAEGFLPLIPMLAAKVLPTLAAKALPFAAKAAGKFLPKLLPKVANVVSKVAPRLMRGVSNITRSLFRNKQSRPLVRAVPTIARRTMGAIARQTAAGRPVSPQTAQRVLARQAARVLGNPQQVQAALRRANTLDRCYHKIAGTPMPPPMAAQMMAQARRGSACGRCGRVA